MKIFESVEQSYSGFLRASDLRKAYLTKRTTPLQVSQGQTSQINLKFKNLKKISNVKIKIDMRNSYRKIRRIS